VALFTSKGHEERIGSFQPLTFWCDDVFTTAKTLKARSVDFAQEPKQEVWGTMAIFKDPDGNQFVISNRLR